MIGWGIPKVKLHYSKHARWLHINFETMHRKSNKSLIVILNCNYKKWRSWIFVFIIYGGPVKLQKRKNLLHFSFCRSRGHSFDPFQYFLLSVYAFVLSPIRLSVCLFSPFFSLKRKKKNSYFKDFALETILFLLTCFCRICSKLHESLT